MATVNIYEMAQTWNNGAVAFTAIGMNVTDTASDAASLLMDLQVGGASKFKVDKDGAIYAGHATKRFEITSPYDFRVTTGSSFDFVIGTTAKMTMTGFGLGLDVLGFGRATAYPTRLTFDGSHILAQRNGANAQTFNIYNTYTDASNYERGFMRWASNEFQIGYEYAGTGNSQRNVRVSAGSGAYLLLDAGGAFNKSTLYSSFQLNLQKNTDVITLQSNFFPSVGDIGLGGDASTTGAKGWDFLTLAERAADVGDPAEGRMTIWQSDGTGSGDDGDIMMKITAGGVTKTVTLVDFSAV